MFKDEISKVFPHLRDGNGDLYNKEYYLEMLKQNMKEERKFDDLKGPLRGDVALDKFTSEFEILMNLKNIFKQLPPISYEK